MPDHTDNLQPGCKPGQTDPPLRELKCFYVRMRLAADVGAEYYAADQQGAERLARQEADTDWASLIGGLHGMSGVEVENVTVEEVT